MDVSLMSLSLSLISLSVKRCMTSAPGNRHCDALVLWIVVKEVEMPLPPGLLHSCASTTRSVARASEQARAEACRRLAGRGDQAGGPRFDARGLLDWTLSKDTGPRDSGVLLCASCRRETAVRRDKSCGASLLCLACCACSLLPPRDVRAPLRADG